ncbi:glycerol-3-phosphate dehydrogenase [NAD(P)+] [Variibacter gotjawalensis]|uniref:Glycerol-3-phosphate dehydrogenase [NAD(P)+] n=2 Tax=Variibacter gotjawalensis TaxID=1333996 RepID=A0A0S3PNI7_9BRAD|nr:NAD(P)H-dependent glycerol-3-phosphate dehydrogenase [Variibacter gotjawalensis]NIK47822.1 glycerol-3-phosphate dehydrogenase (NAD(P)+) [Variibacter gotjawalensis]RZS49709.1 glycerol-3-phosphate dehydrogenase (NAD(P)+) [Variibacter gotjawalensis]BAT57538.1 glycerol-3-phosphate dehydrogenase [NAD(P)+] [Variibacter gotjawalensis]
MNTIAIVGAGAWGTALANAVARAGRDVVLWARDEKTVAAMRRGRVAPRLAGVRIDDKVTPTADLAQTGAADAILLVVPAQALRDAARQLAPHVAASRPVIACAKGIERGTGAFMTEIIAQEIPSAVAGILSGPSFADDVARGLPTAVTLAMPDDAMARDLSARLGSTAFRPYHTDDVRGVEIGGAAKNVLAIASGIVAGRKLGASAAAALTTRGFAELVRFGRAFGARSDTLMGLSGLGDLLLSCSTAQSRNFSFGIALGEGRLASAGKLAEGQFTALALAQKAAGQGVEMPIAQAVCEVVEGRWTVDQAIEALLTRPFRSEGA